MVFDDARNAAHQFRRPQKPERVEAMAIEKRQAIRTARKNQAVSIVKREDGV